MVGHLWAEALTTTAGLFPYLRELESLVRKPGSLPLLNGPGRVPGLATLFSSVSGLVFLLGRRSCGPHLQASWWVGRGSVYSKGLGTCGRKGPRGCWCWEMEQEQAVGPGAPRQTVPTGGLKKPHGGQQLFPASQRQQRPGVNPAAAHEAVRPQIQPDMETQGSKD